MLTKTQLEFICAKLDQDEDTIIYGADAIAYYQNNEEPEYQYSTSVSYLLLAGAYYDNESFDKAAQYLELGIPLFYEQIDWGIYDTVSINMLAVMYKMAEQAFYKAGNVEKGNYYKKQFEDYVWLHDVTVIDMQQITESFCWTVKFE